MKMYLVDYWLPFPESEYGGLQCVIAEDAFQCAKLLLDDADDWYKRYGHNYEELIAKAILDAKVFELSDAENYKAGIAGEFTT